MPVDPPARCGARALERHGAFDEAVVLETLAEQRKGETEDPYQGIRCPKCAWRPRASSRWCCTRRGCGCVWNTFDTRGRCPDCAYQWRDTRCLTCLEWSPHEDWYEKPRPPSSQ